MGSTPWSGPRRSVEALAARLGARVVVERCLDVLAGHDVDPTIVVALGGPPARWALEGGAPGPDYWLRVWALRGLLWNWDDSAAAAVVAALGDDSWRVREMASKVVARHQVDPALTAVVALRRDPVARVREAAERALSRLTAQT